MKTRIITNDYPTNSEMHIMQTMPHNPLGEELSFSSILKSLKSDM